MDNSQEIISLWVGPDSQRLAHHFYALQAQQFFEEGDPTNHKSFWTFPDKFMEEKRPNMIIFDTHSAHLTTIRRVNLSKIIKKMEKPTAEQSYFSFQFMQEKEQQPDQQDPDSHLFQNWQAQECNYFLIDKAFNQEIDAYTFWQDLYKLNSENCEDLLRKKLQTLDFMKLFTLCSDSLRVGFTQKLLEHIKDQCPKTSVVFTSVSGKGDNYFNEAFMPLLSNVSTEVDLYVDFQKQKMDFPYFKRSGFEQHFSPLLNSFYTPFILKDASCSEYISRITSDSKRIFNFGFCLPIINEQSELHPDTNIFDYMPTPKMTKPKEQDIHENRVNFSNTSFLGIFPKKQTWEGKKQPQSDIKKQKINFTTAGLLAQSYVLKGQFKDFQKKFTPRTSSLSLRYMEGILVNNPRNKLQYQDFYEKEYGKIVGNYPFHSVLFQHSGFGASIRNYIAQHKIKGGNELYSDWREKVLALSDCYLEVRGDESD